jgi:hypothetical protein
MTLCTAHDMSNMDSLGLQLPIVIHEISGNFAVRGQFTVSKPTRIHVDSLMTTNNKTLKDWFNHVILSSEVRLENTSGPQIWKPKTDRFVMKGCNNNLVSVEDFEFEYESVSKYYFGYVNDLPQTIGLKNISQNEINILFKTEDFIDYRKKFALYKDKRDIPPVGSIAIDLLAFPEMRFSGTPRITKIA